MLRQLRKKEKDKHFMDSEQEEHVGASTLREASLVRLGPLHQLSLVQGLGAVQLLHPLLISRVGFVGTLPHQVV